MFVYVKCRKTGTIRAFSDVYEFTRRDYRIDFRCCYSSDKKLAEIFGLHGPNCWQADCDVHYIFEYPEFTCAVSDVALKDNEVAELLS